MFRLRCLVMAGVAFTGLAVNGSRIAAEDTGEKSAAEATVRSYEEACEHFDFAKANALLAPDARWIEDSYPAPAELNGKG